MSRLLIAVLSVIGLVLSGSPRVSAQDTPPPKESDSLPTIQLQELDDPAEPIKEVKPRTADGELKVNAQSWLMAGRLLHQREKLTEARDAYEKAAKLDPTNIRIYRSLIELALQMQDSGKALEYATKAVELDPDDFQLLRQLGVEMVKQQKLPQAIEYLEKARGSERLQKNSGFFVLINRDLGIIYSGLGEVEKAADCYDVVLKALLQPSDFGLDRRTRDELQKHRSTSFEQIGTVLMRAQRTDRAKVALERAVDQRNGRPGAVNYLLAQLHFQKDEFDPALEQLETFFEAKLNRGPGPFVLLRQILAKLEQSDSLLDRLKRLAKTDPQNSDLRYFLAEAYLDADDLDEAEKIYRASIEDEPNPRAFMGLARIYRQKGKAADFLENLARVPNLAPLLLQGQDLATAVPALETELAAIEADSKLLDELIELGRERTADGAGANDYAHVVLLAVLAERADRIDTSVEFYNLAIDANPAQSASAFQALGQLLMTNDRYADAADTYQKAIDHNLLAGRRPLFWYYQALALELTGETDKALEAIGSAIQHGSFGADGKAALVFRQTWIYYHAHRYEEAAKRYEDFLAKYPDHSLARQAKFSLSAIYVQLGENKKGEEILEKFLADNPDDPGVNNDLGYLYADQGKNLERAKAMIEKAVAAEPENAAYLDSMGWVLFKLGEFKEAATWLKKATALEDGDDPTLWDHLGDSHHKGNDIAAARKAWKRALELAEESPTPDEKLVKQIKEKLEIHKPKDGAARTESKDDP